MQQTVTRSLALALLTISGSVFAQPAPPPFNLDTGNAPLEILGPTIVGHILQDVSPSAGDATLVLRYTTLASNAWFDAVAPYHPTAQGIYSRLGRRPAAEATLRNLNTAMVYATYRLLTTLTPSRAANWRAMVVAAGLNPDDNSEDTTTAIGIGNRAGRAVAAARVHDGMNQLGDEGGVTFNREPFADYTGYQPVNTAYELRDPSRWQPRSVSSGFGIFRVQQFVTPQYARTRPYSYTNPNQFQAPRPSASDPRGNRQGYQEQADEVINSSANLTDRQKMTSEFFNDKLNSLGFSAFFAAQSRGVGLIELIQFDFLTNMAAFDTGIAIWNQKTRWDAVRPFSAIRYLYGDRPIRAWGGPGKGTVNIPASQWREYLNVADHPEYPSGSASFCGAHAQAARRWSNSDTLNLAVPFARGSSKVEPGLTPATDIMLGPWPTWTDFETDCGNSRIWGGVHFRSAVEQGRPIGHAIGNAAYDFVKRHVDGNAPPLP